MPNLENEIWKYFDREDDVYASCTYCARLLSYKTTTANLKSHLRRHDINMNPKQSKSVPCDVEEEAIEEEVWQDSEGEVWEPVWDACSEDEVSIEEFSKEGISKISNNLDEIDNEGKKRKCKESLWKHFDKVSNGLARCKYCTSDLSYKSSTGNLYAHIKRKHTSIELEERKRTDDNTSKKQKKGQIWTHFKKVSDTLANCNYCDAFISFKSTTGSLTVHLKRKHLPKLLANEIDDDEDKNSDSDEQNSRNPIQTNPSHRRQFGRIWKHFNKIDNTYASCKYCKSAKLSYKTTSGNLGSHLKAIHPSIYLAYINDKSVTNKDNVTLENIKRENSELSKIEGECHKSREAKNIVGPLREAGILKHFYKKDSEVAICKYCSISISYKNTEDLNTHLRKSHTQIYMMQQSDIEGTTSNIRIEQIDSKYSEPDMDNYSDQDVNYSDSDQEENKNSKTPSLRIKTKAEIIQNSSIPKEPSELQSEETPRKSNNIWEHFVNGDDRMATCIYCNNKISYRSTTGNLRSHLKKKHGLIYLPQQNNTDQNTNDIKKEIWMVPTPIGLPSESPHNQNKAVSTRKPGEVWTHFDKIDNTHATCRYCNVAFSYKTSTGNLTTHLRKSHTSIYMAQKINNDANIIWICNDSNPLQLEDEPQPKRRKKLQDRNNSTKLTQEEKKRADMNLLKLFIYDYQSFSIMEDKGFAAFVNSISEYSLPDKKSISSEIIPALYDKTLKELKETVSRDVCSVCLTTEFWISSQNENYLAVTAHYIDINFEPQLILLECTHLNSDRTSENLAHEIKRIITEWQLSTRVIFAIADNSKNIEHAIENLEWNGYGCYSHALNIIFLYGLKPVEQLIGDINKIIGHFKNSQSAQEMLINYQIRNSLGDEESIDLIQDMPSHWSGTFYMLRRFVQLNEAIQYCMALDDTECWPVFSAEEWEIASQLYEVLETFEEVTSSILGDRYMSGSLVIIITNCLKTICEDFLEKDEYSHYKPEIKEVIAYVNGDLTEKFSAIEFNKDFALCTLLDPRFKCYGFHDDNAYADIKTHAQNLLVEVLNNNECNLTETEVDTEGSKDVSAWDRFDKILKQRKPPQNTSVKAERELQMYLDDDMMPRKNLDGHWNNPAQWWREHQIIYPNLAEIYRTRCNVVGTSVPWDRLYSKRGQMMRERRSYLKAGEVEKLVFLNANLNENKFEDINV